MSISSSTHVVSGVFARLVTGVANHFRLRATSWFTAFLMLNLGIALFGNHSMFEEPCFRYLSAYLSSVTVAVFCYVLALLRLAALIVNGTFPKFKLTPYVRTVAGTLSAAFWVQLVLGAFSTRDASLGSVIAPVLVVVELYNTAIAAIEMRE